MYVVATTFDGDRTIEVTATEPTRGLIMVTTHSDKEVTAAVTVNPDLRLTITPLGDTFVGEKRTKSFSVFKGASIGTLTAQSSNAGAVSVRLTGSGNNVTLEATGVTVGGTSGVYVEDGKGNYTPTINLNVLDLLLTADVPGITFFTNSNPIPVNFNKGKDVGVLRGMSADESIATLTTSDGSTFVVTPKGAAEETQIWVVDDKHSIESDKLTITVIQR